MLNKDQLFFKGVCFGYGWKILDCNDPLGFKANGILMCETNMRKCQVHKWTKQVLKKKKDSSALVFLEEAAELGCWVSFSNGHFPRCLFLTESADILIKRLPRFTMIPKSSSKWLCFCMLVFCFLKLQTKVRSPPSSSKTSFVAEPECRPLLCSEHSLCSSSVSFFQQGKYIQYIHYLYPLELAHAAELL